MRSRRLIPLAIATAAFIALSVPAAFAEGVHVVPPGTQEVLVVANNWDGTADVVDPRTFKRYERLNIIPDLQMRLAEIAVNPERQAYFLAIRELVGEGHDQYVDDAFTSTDGRFLFVSRPSLADVVAFDLATKTIVWRTPVDGQRSDHMAISPDGTRLLVSASTANKVHVIDTATGKIVANFPTGDQPHESNYSSDGKRIYHASIGTVYTPTDDYAFDSGKGARIFQIVDGTNYNVIKQIDMGKKLAEAGYPNMSSAVRPMAVALDEKFVYFQVSFHHGFVEYDLVNDKVTRVARLPLSHEAANTRREDYLLDSAHHGLAMNPAGTKLCAAGTMSGYAAIVSRRTFNARIVNVGPKPYWSTNSGDGKYCFVSVSATDSVAVIDYASEEQIATFKVGFHPQRMRIGQVKYGLLNTRAPVVPSLRVSITPTRVARGKAVSVRTRVTARIEGVVRSVRGARVQLAGISATTNSLGRATIRLPRGLPFLRRYSVRARRAGYRTGTTWITVKR